MKFIILIIVLSSPCFPATYYVAAAGADTNNGTSKITPWAHAPGMSGCANTCAATTPAAGDSIIFKGGDSWTIAAAWNFPASGTLGNSIYVGVDQTWFTGGAFARPILTGGGTFPGAAASGNFINLGSRSYVTIDDFDFTGMNWTVSVALMGYIQTSTAQSGILVENSYFHGWTHGAAAENDSVAAVVCGGGGSSFANTFTMNVVDGSDTTENSFMGVQGACWGDVSKNEFKQLMYGFNGNAKLVHDNVFDSVGFVSYDGVSHNGVLLSSDDIAGGSIYYNNVLINGLPGQSGGVPFWQTPELADTSYQFNNVFPNANNLTGTSQWCMNYFSGGGPSGGQCAWFNNTMECGLDATPPANQCFRYGGQTGIAPSAIKQYNQHAITGVGITPASLGFDSTGCDGVTTCVLTTSNFVIQSKATASGQGFTLGQTYPFSPTVGTNSTVGAGLNKVSLCTAISAVDSAAGTACLSDTTYGVSYNTSTHAVTFPARTAVLRPASGAWDVGAYQFVNPINANFSGVSLSGGSIN